MTIPSPPADTSGGYMITTYNNATDTHRMRTHIRAFGSDGTYTTPGAGTPGTVQLDWTGFITRFSSFYNNAWVFNMTALFQNNGDGTFTELFGWAAPAQIAGSGATATPADQTRALEAIFNFRDGHGGRGRVIAIGAGSFAANQVPLVVGGVPGTAGGAALVDYVTNPIKTNIVGHGGHQLQSPGRITFAVNKRLRRHYGFS